MTVIQIRIQTHQLAHIHTTHTHSLTDRRTQSVKYQKLKKLTIDSHQRKQALCDGKYGAQNVNGMDRKKHEIYTDKQMNK